MKTVFKKILVLTIVMLMALIVSGNAYATSIKCDVYPDKADIKPGETLTLEMKLLEVDAGDLGVNVIEAVLEYDEKVFEPVTKDNFAMQNNWTISINKESSGIYKLLMSKAVAGVKDKESLGIVKLKAKADVNPQDINVKLRDIETNDGESIINGNDINLSLRIIPAPAGDNNNGNGNNNDNNNNNNNDNGSGNNGSNNNGSNGSNNGGTSSGGSNQGTYQSQTTGQSSGSSSNTNTANETKNNSTTGASNNKVNPKTGDSIMIVVGILVLAVVGIVAIAIIKKKINTKE